MTGYSESSFEDFASKLRRRMDPDTQGRTYNRANVAE